MKTAISLLIILSLSITLLGGLTAQAEESGPTPRPVPETVRVLNSNGNEISTVTSRTRNFTVVVTFIDLGLKKDDPINIDKSMVSMTEGGAFVSTTNTRRGALSRADKPAEDFPRFEARFSSLNWVGTGNSMSFDVFYAIGDGEPVSAKINVTVHQARVETDDNSSSDDDEDEPLKADIVVESVTARDKSGAALTEVTKDTPPFDLSITYLDFGLREVAYDDITSSGLQVFMTNAGGFTLAGSTRGAITRLARETNRPPRFRVDFKDVVWDGTSNTIAMQVRYSIDGQDFTGEIPATVYQARAKTEDEKTEQLVPPPTPFIIVTHYDTGGDRIEAGQRFTLDLTFRNTSSSTPLENIIMTIDPGEDISIASASNTYYISALSIGDSLRHALELEAKPTARVGSHSINVTFTYEYLVQRTTEQTERVSKDSKETIAVTLTQIDRFEVDPIAEVPPARLGEEALISVTFINRGVSATSNISARIEGNLQIIAPAEHYGSLEGGGKADTIDVPLIPQEPGEFHGQVVIQYEDDNRKQKEISVPFTMYVEAPYVPEQPGGMFPDPGMTQEPPPNNTGRIILGSAGGLLMAAPIAMYLMKKIKAKAEEDNVDDDF